MNKITKILESLLNAMFISFVVAISSLVGTALTLCLIKTVKHIWTTM